LGGSGAEGASVCGLGLAMDDSGCLFEPVLVCVEGNPMLTCQIKKIKLY